MHHIIDPSTGAPAVSTIVSATAVSRHAARSAEVAAKAALLAPTGRHSTRSRASAATAWSSIIPASSRHRRALQPSPSSTSSRERRRDVTTSVVRCPCIGGRRLGPRVGGSPLGPHPVRPSFRPEATPGVVARPPPLPRRARGRLHRTAHRGGDRRQLRPLHPRGGPRPLRLDVATARRRVGHRGALPVAGRRAHFLARRHLSKRSWRTVHFASFPLFVVATAHGLAAGTDTTSKLALLVAGAATVLVVALTLVRIADARRTGPRPLAVSRTAGRARTCTIVSGAAQDRRHAGVEPSSSRSRQARRVARRPACVSIARPSRVRICSGTATAEGKCSRTGVEVHAGAYRCQKGGFPS